MTEQLNNEPLQLAGGGLIYRLSAPASTGGYNVDEINVTMWGGSRSPEVRAEGAQRVLACVAACDGISTDNLLDNVHVKELARRYNEVIRKRDLLLAALENLVARCDGAEGVRPDGSNIDTRSEHAIIAAIVQQKDGSAC